MNSNMKNKVFSNVTSLSIKAYKYFEDYNKVAAAGERFFQVATLLATGNHIGLQISAEKEGGCSAIAFSDSDDAITAEDYAWVFHGCVRYS